MFPTRGLDGRLLKTLSGAVSLLTAFCALSLPVMAARHHHFSHFSFRSHVRRSHGSHAQRLAAIQARHVEHAAQAQAHEAKVQAQTTALRSGDVVRAATAFQGTRYVFGGTSRSGFDCSGFTRYILGASEGVALPRTAMEQYYNGQSVSTDELKPGDLVFFKGTYKSGVSHVGIYIGDGHFVHACNERRGVTTDSLSDPYYANHYAGARRVIIDRAASER